MTSILQMNPRYTEAYQELKIIAPRNLEPLRPSTGSKSETLLQGSAGQPGSKKPVVVHSALLFPLAWQPGLADMETINFHETVVISWDPGSTHSSNGFSL